MGRKPGITRDELLMQAEAIVRSDGAKALTIDALAKAAGISKGGVQYLFSSKDDLVEQLIERWIGQFDRLFENDDGAPPAALIGRYIAEMRSSQQAMNAKMAGLMISYIQNPENLQATRVWYETVFARLAGPTLEAKSARVAFLAVEGLFLMRIIGFDADGDWTGFLDDVEAVLTQLVPAEPVNRETT